MTEDPIEKAIGRFGRYQTWVIILLTVGRLPSEFELHNMLFIVPKTDYICLDHEARNASNFCPCQNPLFDTDPIVSSVTSDFKLICDRAALSSLVQSILQAGVAAGGLFYGYISDRFGRRISIVLALFFDAAFTSLSAFSSQVWMVLVCRFLSGTAIGGTMPCCFVLVIELSGKSFRTQAMGLAELGLLAGDLMLPLVAYFVRDWRSLKLVGAAPWLLVVVYYWLLPESPRWLITVGKRDEAIAVLTHIAKRNNRPTKDIEAIVDQEAEILAKDRQQSKGSYADLFKTPKIRMYSIVTPYIWAVCGLTYYGVMQYIGHLGGNLYLNVSLSVACMAPTLILVVFICLYVRRKVSLFTLFSVTAAALLLFIFVPKNMASVILALAITGQIAVYAAFVLTYLFTTEVFPTVIRNSAMGLCSLFGRVGGFAAPFVVNIGVEWVSMLIFSMLPVTAAVACFFLPETKNIVLFNSVDQTESAHTSKTSIEESKPIDLTTINVTSMASKTSLMQ